MEINVVTSHIVDAAIKVHSVLGPGLLESAYEACMIYELRKRAIHVRNQVEQMINYDGMILDVGYRLDLLVEDIVIAEIKSVHELAPIHKAQILSYLRLSKKRIGLLLNFNVERMKDGIIRFAN